MAKLEALQKNIETLRAAIPELRGVLIASTEGLPVAHSIAGGADPARAAAMADRIAEGGRPRAAARIGSDPCDKLSGSHREWRYSRRSRLILGRSTFSISHAQFRRGFVRFWRREAC